MEKTGGSAFAHPYDSSGLSNRMCGRRSALRPPKPVRKGDDPVQPCNHYTRVSSHLDPSQSSLGNKKGRHCWWPQAHTNLASADPAFARHAERRTRRGFASYVEHLQRHCGCHGGGPALIKAVLRRCEPARQQRHEHNHCAENLPRFHDTAPYHPL